MSDNPSFEVDAPDHFTAGAIGPPVAASRWR